MDLLRQRLCERAETVVDRWFTDVLTGYPNDAAAAFGRERDRFANPVGYSLRLGTRAVFDALIDGVDPARIRHALEEIVRIRAVQQFATPDAVAFVFRLKAAIRHELGPSLADPQVAAELRELEDRIDRAALVAFEIFTECRARIAELRINELKRSLPWMVERMKQG